ncbi:hypothetical protein [Janthinobacterium sp. B9-8]|uniref:hypothetical protein n=1 Tax=Janthinobacterium sp. B9-8 TaxID=1236179 RepID=UPI00069A5D94|nr:hypothetical protein [Janthinobacterium sp. B9-8]AMC34730.1 hypothetical protein VN23_08970 [Janthinobacterium sp. B9-8]
MRAIDKQAAANVGVSSSGQVLAKVVPKSLTGRVIVPKGATKCLITGVAAGGRPAAGIPLANGLPNTSIIAASPLGNYVFSMNSSGSTTPAAMIDPVGRKVGQSLVTGGTVFNATAVGIGLLVADNGVAVAWGYNASYSPYITLDGGLNWAQSNVPVTSGSANARLMAMAPAACETASPTSMRIASLSGTASVISSWNGSAFTNSAAYASTLASMHYANGYFLAASSSAGDKTAFFYQTAADSVNPAGWPKVTVDAVNVHQVGSVIYAFGLYIILCTDGTIYTSSTINGTYTQRTSGLTSGSTLLFGNARVIAFGNKTSTTTDGITWTAVTLTGLTTAIQRICFASRTGHFVALATGGLFWSVDGLVWTLNAASSSFNLVSDHPSGVIAAVEGSATYNIFPDITVQFFLSPSTSGDGGNLRVIRQSDYMELLTLGGGLNTRFGGCTTSASCGDSSINNGVGIGGMGYLTGVSLGSGNAAVGITGAAVFGGGAVPMAWEITPQSYGVKFAGGSGGAGATSTPAGGGSIMARPNVQGRAIGFGAGAGGNGTTNAGGGGEGVVRFMVDVVEGDVLLFGAGMPMANQASNLFSDPSCGHIAFEFI